MQDPILARRRTCTQKQSLAPRLLSKALFYYKHYVLSIYKLQCNVKGKGQLQVVFAPKSALRKCFYIWLSLTFKLIIENCLSFWKIKCLKNWSYQKVKMTKNVLLIWYYWVKKIEKYLLTTHLKVIRLFFKKWFLIKIYSKLTLVPSKLHHWVQTIMHNTQGGLCALISWAMVKFLFLLSPW